MQSATFLAWSKFKRIGMPYSLRAFIVKSTMFLRPKYETSPWENSSITGDFLFLPARQTALKMSMLSTLKAPIANFSSSAFLNQSFAVIEKFVLRFVEGRTLLFVLD